MPDIEIRNITKYFGKGERLVKAVDGITLTINGGQFASVIGRSGSGKTTLLDCLGLLSKPSSGSIVIDGVDVLTLSGGDQAEFRSKRIGFIFQGFNLLPSLTAIDNVLLPLRYGGGDKAAARKRADQLLEEVGMTARKHHRPTELSGGEQQRIAIARALINEPAMVLGDEPTGEVDSETSEILVSLMKRLNRDRGVTFVIVTHDQSLAAQTDRIIRLKDGRVVSDEVIITGRS
ncbi:MAG: ABC transporter ATP-binding protein [Dehalococcoidia bacterium]|nr:ABC transporter ATP-binding protein [Dehalococcoidia bacterium]